MAFAFLIAGPTASGKSALALARAKQQGGRIVNADSMQVYAGLRLLSARPDAGEVSQAPHHLFGFVLPGEEFSVGRYLQAITPLIAEARAGGAPLVIVGGTGLYYRALTEGLMPTPDIAPDIRALWRERAAKGDDLHAELMRRDPDRATKLAPADHPRILRAIELFEATGIPYSRWLVENPGEPLLKAGEWEGVFLDAPKAWLDQRIAARFVGMMADGALEEVAALLAYQPPLPANLGVMKAHGVPHLAAFLRGEISEEEAISRSITDTSAYARRQKIFARKYLKGPNWRWMDPSAG